MFIADAGMVEKLQFVGTALPFMKSNFLFKVRIEPDLL